MMKKLFLGAAALTLSACGFTPMHSTASPTGMSSFRNVTVEMIEPDQASQKEAAYYIDQVIKNRIGTNIGEHTLRLEPRITRRPYGLTTNDVASRYDMVVSVTYTLLDNENGETLDNGTIRAITTFGSSRDPYARISAEKSATEQVSRDAADRILVRLASYYKDPDRRARERAEKEAEREARRAEKEAEKTARHSTDNVTIETVETLDDQTGPENP